jgi:tripartite-type tricarboxylate transporter receptor subunit TctC
MLKRIITASVSGALLTISAAASAQSADDKAVADFYKGKQMKFVIRSEPGGGFDLYSRLIARHIVRYIPGNPTIIPQNMPGAGGIIAANYMGDLAPKDGTHLTMISQALPMDQALGFTPNLKADLRTFGWLGNLGDSNMLTFTWHTSPTKTMEDAKKRETLMGGTGAQSISYWMPFIYNAALGTKIKMIHGYKSSGEMRLAMQRGEVEGYGGQPWVAVKSSSAEMVAKKQFNYLVQVGVRKEKELPNVPLLTELATTEEGKAIADFVSKSLAVGRTTGTTPGVPPERLAALRKAFMDATKDPLFLSEAEKAGEGAEIEPIDGLTVQQMIADVLGAPQAIRDKVKSVLPERN